MAHDPPQLNKVFGVWLFDDYILVMKCRTISGLLGAVVLTGSGGWAQVRDNPYQDIVVRNAFALKPIPPPPPPGVNTPPPSPVDVVLTGISTLGGNKKVLLTITDKSPGKGKTDYPPPLVEGDVEGRVEVVSINPDTGKVVIKIDGEEKTLGFEKEAAKAAGAAPGPSMVPGANPAGTLPLPGMTPPAAAATAASPGAYGVMVGGGAASAPATAAPRTPVSLPGGLGASAATAVPASFGSDSTDMPARPLRTVVGGADGLPGGMGGVVMGGGVAASTPAASAAASAQAPAAPIFQNIEQVYSHIEEQRQLQNEAVALYPHLKDRLGPPLPPTPYTPKSPAQGANNPVFPSLPPIPQN